MRLESDLKAEMQAAADKMHAYLIATSPAYAASVAKGQTLRWDIPRLPVDANGQPVPGGKWFAIVKDKCLPALTKTEVVALINKTPAATDAAK